MGDTLAVRLTNSFNTPFGRIPANMVTDTQKSPGGCRYSVGDQGSLGSSVLMGGDWALCGDRLAAFG